MNRRRCGWFRKSDAMITVRSAEPRDARAMAEVHVASWRAAYHGLLPDELLRDLSVDAREREWAAGLAKPEKARRIVVAEFDGCVVGFASYGPNRDADGDPARMMELYTLYLREEAWGRGCGRALWLETLRRVRAESGVIAITLWVLADNIRAARFYEKAGFLVDGVIKDIALYGVTRVETRYRRPLP